MSEWIRVLVFVILGCANGYCIGMILILAKEYIAGRRAAKDDK